MQKNTRFTSLDARLFLMSDFQTHEAKFARLDDRQMHKSKAFQFLKLNFQSHIFSDSMKY